MFKENQFPTTNMNDAPSNTGPIKHCWRINGFRALLEKSTTKVLGVRGRPPALK